MFSGLFNQGNQDQTHEHIWDASLVDNMFDFLDQEYRRHADEDESNHYGDDALRHGELGPRHLFMAILITFLIEFENLIEDGVMAMQVVKDIPTNQSRK